MKLIFQGKVCNAELITNVDPIKRTVDLGNGAVLTVSDQEALSLNLEAGRIMLGHIDGGFLSTLSAQEFREQCTRILPSDLSEYQVAERTGKTYFVPWEEGMDLSGVSISIPDKENGSPKGGDVIAVNPDDMSDKWLISKEYFEKNLRVVDPKGAPLEGKTLHNTTASQAKDNVRDIEFWGDGDAWKLLGKAWSKTEGWMKSTKAMEVPGGVALQVSTQQGDNVAEAVTYVPGVKIEEVKDAEGKVIGRKLI